MENKDSPSGNVIFWNVHSTSNNQIYGLLTSASLLGKTRIDVLEEQLYAAFERYVDTRKHYEEEMKKTCLREKNSRAGK